MQAGPRQWRSARSDAVWTEVFHRCLRGERPNRIPIPALFLLSADTRGATRQGRSYNARPPGIIGT